MHLYSPVNPSSVSETTAGLGALWMPSTRSTPKKATDSDQMILHNLPYNLHSNFSAMEHKLRKVKLADFRKDFPNKRHMLEGNPFHARFQTVNSFPCKTGHYAHSMTKKTVDLNHSFLQPLVLDQACWCLNENSMRNLNI